MRQRESNGQEIRTKRTARKWIKIGIGIIGGLLLLLTVAWFVLTWYINSHKKQLLANITEKISEHISGKLLIDDMEPALLKGFPNISIRLASVRLRDSLYAVYKEPTIDLKSVFVELNVLSLLTKHPTIEKVTLADGEIHFFTQQNGYANGYLFRSKKPKKKNRKKTEINIFGLENVTFVYRHVPHKKEFNITLRTFEGHIRHNGDVEEIAADLDAHVHQLGFNLSKGGYLTNKNIEGRLQLHFDRVKKTLELPAQTLTIDKNPIRLKALFEFGKQPALFDLDILASSINFTDAANMLSQNISKKLNQIEVAENIWAHALIKGSFQYPDTPYVHVYIQVKDNQLKTPYGSFEHVTFNPEFHNYIVKGKGRGDNNSGIVVPTFSGEWMGIPMHADSTLVYGLVHPLLTTHVHSSFPTARLNQVVGSSFSLQDGQAAFRLSYRGPLTPTDTFQRSLNGYFTLKNAAVTYLPRNLKFKDCDATLLFRGEDLHFKDVNLSTQKSKIHIDGLALQFLNAYFNDPSKAVFDWNLKSDLIDLNEFKTFLTPRRSAPISQKRKNKKIRKFNRQLDQLLAKSTVALDVDVKQVTYRRFNARAIRAGIILQESSIKIDNLQLKHAGGRLSGNAKIAQKANGNPFDIHAKIDQVKIDQLFYAFENFGQTAIESSNLEGIFSADVSLKGGLTESATIIKNSFQGSVDFTLENGELNNFPPFLTISKFIFKKRNLDHITFKKLQDHLEINQGKIYIDPMKIESSALIINIEGVYALGKGTDIRMQIPLRNPQKDRIREEEGRKPRKGKGLTVHLRATDGDDGKVRIGWDPLQERRTTEDAPMFDDDSTHTDDEFQLPD